MIYFLLVGAMALGSLVALGFMIAAIVQTARARWKSAAACTVVMILSLVIVAGTGLWLAATGLARAVAEAKVQAREYDAQIAQQKAELAEADRAAMRARGASIQSLTPEALRDGIDDAFWGDSGEFAWYRRPLRFPYVVISVDTLNHGGLSINSHNGKCDAGAEGINKIPDVTHYTFDEKMFLCRQDRAGMQKWILYRFDGAGETDYVTESDLLNAARDARFTGPLPLKTVKQQYDEYWK